MRSECVVVGPPFFNHPSGLGQTGEEVLVEALVAQLAIEALDGVVLGRISETVRRPRLDWHAT
jgi:hypothetical protein